MGRLKPGQCVELACCGHRFEKYIGGKYLGDLLRAALARLARAGLLPRAPPPGSITSAHLSLFEE